MDGRRVFSYYPSFVWSTGCWLRRQNTRITVTGVYRLPVLVMCVRARIVMSICHKLESFGKREPQLRKCPNRIDLWASLCCSFFISDWCRRAQATVRSATLLAGGPWVYKKINWESLGEHASKQHVSMASTSVPASRFLPWLPSTTDCNLGM